MDVKGIALKTTHTNSFIVTLILATYSTTNKCFKYDAHKARAS